MVLKITMVGRFLGKGEKPLGKVVEGQGNNGEDQTEGVVYRNVFGSYFHGPLLARNEHLAERLIRTALKTAMVRLTFDQNKKDEIRNSFLASSFLIDCLLPESLADSSDSKRIIEVVFSILGYSKTTQIPK